MYSYIQQPYCKIPKWRGKAETAKANGKNPQAYFENIFEKIQQSKSTDDLLP